MSVGSLLDHYPRHRLAEPLRKDRQEQVDQEIWTCLWLSSVVEEPSWDHCHLQEPQTVVLTRESVTGSLLQSALVDQSPLAKVRLVTPRKALPHHQNGIG